MQRLASPPFPLANGSVPSNDFSVATLASLLGARFLAYVCGSSEGTIERYLAHEEGQLSECQERAFAETIKAAAIVLRERRIMSVNGRDVLEPASEAFGRFTGYLPDKGMSGANALRKLSGASLPAIDTDDPLKLAARRVARDWYPAVLVRQEDSLPWGPTPFPVRAGVFSFAHPGLEEFVQAVRMPTEPLRRLFQDGAEVTALSSSRSYVSSSGHGASGTQISTLLIQVLSNAEGRVYISGADLEPETFLSAIDAQIDELRAVASGAQPDVPVAVGVGPISVAPDFRLETPWGTLRAPSEWEAQQGHQRDTTGLVLQLTVPLRVVLDVDLQDPASALPPELGNLTRDVERRVDMVRLLLLLGLGRDAPVAVVSTWRLVSEPLTMHAFSWSPGEPLPSVGSIEEEDKARLEEWALLLEEHYDATLDLAVRRLLSAIGTRYDDEDGVVDAVIALESLFGTGQSEVGFRLSAALAWLLETDSDARLGRQKSISRLYNLRSQIVHGARVDPSLLSEGRREASQTAVAALRALFKETPYLISLGNQRGKYAILQVSPRSASGT